MNLSNANVLVTGGGGFIGSHLSEALVSRAKSVRALVHYNALGQAGWLETSENRNNMDVVFGDITDRDSVRDAMQGIDIVFHLAALIPIPYSYKAPMSYVRTNIEGTLNVLQQARDSGQLILHTSTSEVYGTALRIPIDEDHPLQGQSPYSASKIGADKMVESFVRSFGVRAITMRPFNTFGPRQSARAVIPTIIMQAVTDPSRAIRLGSLSPKRDMNYVSNTVDGYIKAAKCDAAIGRTINLASNTEASIGDIVDMVSGIIGHKLVIETDESRIRPKDSEVERLLGANALAHELIGWKPDVDLYRGLEQTVEWMRKHIRLYRPMDYAV